jgi:hypothetical protein
MSPNLDTDAPVRTPPAQDESGDPPSAVEAPAPAPVAPVAPVAPPVPLVPPRPVSARLPAPPVPTPVPAQPPPASAPVNAPVGARYCWMCDERVPVSADGLYCHLGHRLSPAHAKRRRGLFRRRG